MLNLCVKNCVSAHGRHFFLFKQSFCYQINLVIEKCRIQKPKNYCNFHFFVKVLLIEKKMHLQMTMKMKILGQCQHHPPDPPTQWPSTSSSEPLQPNQVSSRGRGTQRKTSLISSRGHRGRQWVSTSDILSCGDSQIDRQDTPEPSPSTSGASRTCTGLWGKFRWFGNG